MNFTLPFWNKIREKIAGQSWSHGSRSIFIAILPLLLVSGCVSFVSFKLTKVDPDALIHDFSEDLKVPERLSRFDVKTDLVVLLDTLQKGYVGWKRLDPSLISSFKMRLEALENVSDDGILSGNFCLKIQALFQEIPDSVLMIRDPHKKPCGLKSKIPMVGKNVLSGKTRPWSVKTQGVTFLKKSELNGQIALVAIVHFDAENAADWNGFGAELEHAMANSKAVVVDLRGASGENTDAGYILASQMMGQRPRLPVETFLNLRTAQALAARINALNLKLFEKNFRDESEARLRNQLDLLRKDFNKASKGQGVAQELSDFELRQEPLPEKMYPNPILVLTDTRCESACEKTIELLKNHPQTLLVGEPTRGHYQMGGPGIIVLPQSHFFVQFPTQFTEYLDHRWSEKFGIAPDILVPAGQDALEFATERVLPNATLSSLFTRSFEHFSVFGN